MGDHQGLDHIVKKLDEEEALIQKEAIIALGRLGNPQAVPHILSKLNREELQSEALLALEKLGFADLDYFFQVFYTFNTRIKCALVDLIGRTGDERAVDHLTSILLEEFYTVRCRAARALGEIKDRQAIPALLQAHREDPSEEVRKAAAMALKKLDSRS
jgi:HEAT repeat protein